LQRSGTQPRLEVIAPGELLVQQLDPLQRHGQDRLDTARTLDRTDHHMPQGLAVLALGVDRGDIDAAPGKDLLQQPSHGVVLEKGFAAVILEHQALGGECDPRAVLGHSASFVDHGRFAVCNQPRDQTNEKRSEKCYSS